MGTNHQAGNENNAAGGLSAASLPPAPWHGLDLDRLDTLQKQIWDAGYSLGYQHGIDRGREQAESEIAADWAALACKVRALAGTKAFAELRRARGEAP